ncbi:hypothetical protein SYNTR_1677 [Candidatus Syntrophocurvum alkaliphilum]|uniref:SLH domain-containing protein n=1 Tax=Candidatus Syntrophocurvum alkaliphilum TaxID=2293317 RepID=A0A6I6DC74_9FIRM|nr:S-layer homology domain-containing protein [Candidatus Syntrophocurvum alkaliphilum]QGU00271.1 hypothetical protein SYNTR_1677 [Candidatus Syntrophocurvum alkaliphilum]
MKKYQILIACTVCFFFFFPSIALADKELTVREAIELVKTKIDIPEDATEFRSNYNEVNERGQWELNWQSEDQHIRVNVDQQTGNIHRMYSYDRTDETTPTLLPNVSEEKAFETAYEFMKLAIPNQVDQLKFKEEKNIEPRPLRFRSQYTFHFERIVNDITYVNNSASISICTTTGNITNYNFNWNYDADFVSPDNLITKEQAKEALESEIFELMYYKPSYADEKVVLIYGIRNVNQKMVDAKTGELYGSNQYRNYDKRELDGMVEEAAEGNLSPLELEEVELIEGIIPQEEAIKEAFKYFPLHEGFELSQTRMYEDYRDSSKRNWHFQWRNNENATDISGRVTATVDANTGEVYAFSKNIHDRDNQRPRYSKDEALKIADEFLKTHQPQKNKEIKLLNDNTTNVIDDSSQTANFRYVRLVDDIPFYNNGFNLSVNRVTGEVTSYSFNWSDYNFPDSSNIIDKESAFKKILKANPLVLNYVNTTNNNKINLYYHLSKNEPVYIDAVNKDLLTNSGQIYEEKDLVKFTDIKNHPAEQDISLLTQLGVISGSNNKFYPDQNATNAEFIKMLILAMGASPGEGKELNLYNDEWYAPYYQTAINRNIIDLDNLPAPNDDFKRITAAQLMVNSRGLNEIASFHDIFKFNVKDANNITNENTGYAALSYKLGYLNIQDSNFYPQNVLTRAEAASTIIEYMRNTER